MYYEKKMKPRTYYINVFLRNWSFLLAFHNEYEDSTQEDAQRYEES